MSMDAVILAGGLATRLNNIMPDTPKALIEINGRPFITYQFDRLLEADINRVIICTGHLSEKFPKTIGHQYKELNIIYSTEIEPLGTGGAIDKASTLILSSNCLVMNGDSYIDTQLNKFISWHSNTEFKGSILVTTQKSENRYGNITIDELGKIKSFSEKGNSDENHYISTGHYIFNSELIGKIPKRKNVSLEYDCFPFWIDDGLGGFYQQAKFIDVGTPDSLIAAANFFKDK